jgi:hypothetical protein
VEAVELVEAEVVEELDEPQAVSREPAIRRERASALSFLKEYRMINRNLSIINNRFFE